MRTILFVLLLLEFGFAQNREALLIGNSNYQYMSNLNDTSSNLSNLKSVLEGLDFKVTDYNNLDSKNLKQAIENFRNRLARKRDTIGFFYYSGHGCQLNNVGYLLPTNVDSRRKLDIKYDAMNIDKLLETVDGAGNRLNMLFLDACRNVPTGVRGGTKGLGQAPLTPKGTLLVYATEAKKTANDNNRFINSLMKHIQEPNKQIWEIADNISNDVADQTEERQIPEVFTKRLPRMVLKSGYVPPIPPKPTYTPIVPPSPVATRRHSTKDIVQIGSLMYQNQPFTKRYNWKDAKGYCQDLTLGGYSDWRLPSKSELMKLVTTTKNQGYYIRKEFAKNLKGWVWFWSSTTYEKNSSGAWCVYFNNGFDYWGSKTSQNYALCVR